MNSRLECKNEAGLIARVASMAIFSFAVPYSAAHADGSNLPLATLSDFSAAYQGAFKVDHTDDVSTTAWARGRVAYNPENESVFIDSHAYDNAVGEFRVPASFSKSSNTDDLPEAEVIQGFMPLLDRDSYGQDQGIDSIGGMAVVNGELFVQTFEYYDAAANNTNTTLILRAPQNLSTSTIDGYFQMEGAAKTVNYLSPIPYEWRETFNGSYIAGNGGGVPINTRLSIGPSLYTFNPDEILTSSGFIPTTEWMSYSLSSALSIDMYTYQDDSGPWDSYNHTGMNSNFSESNNLWTEKSSAWFGFIVPGTRTFAVIGESGMHESGGGYKITQWDGNLCGGPCPNDPDDSYPYYWLYDLNDIVSASQPHEPKPYEYGKFENRFPDGFPSSGSFDLESGKLFLLHRGATASDNGGDPVVSVYKFDESSFVKPKPPSNVTIGTSTN